MKFIINDVLMCKGNIKKETSLKEENIWKEQINLNKANNSKFILNHSVLRTLDPITNNPDKHISLLEFFPSEGLTSSMVFYISKDEKMIVDKILYCSNMIQSSTEKLITTEEAKEIVNKYLM